MKERPILFSGAMVRAILEGRKTQTRRVVKHQPVEFFDTHGSGKPALRWWNGAVSRAESPIMPGVLPCPYGQPGDRLWVRETARCDYQGETPPTNKGSIGVEYQAGGGRITDYTLDRKGDYPWFPSRCRNIDGSPRWAPAIHMPRWASRITLEITGVRVERLQDISEADAIAEGICNWEGVVATAKDAYASLWESINGAGSWESNPLVWVVEFKRGEQ